MNEEFEDSIHQARLLSIQGKYAESIQKYNEAFQALTEYMNTTSSEEQALSEKKLKQLIEEIDTVKAAYLQKEQEHGFQSQVSQSIPLDTKPEQEVPEESNIPSYGPMFEDLSRAFIFLGRNIREFDERYKITATCGKVATDIANKTVEMVNRPEIQNRISSVEQSIKQWNEENHVTENIGNVFNSVASTTERVFDSLFPNLFSQPSQQEVQEPINDELYNSLPIATPVESNAEEGNKQSQIEKEETDWNVSIKQ